MIRRIVVFRINDSARYQYRCREINNRNILHFMINEGKTSDSLARERLRVGASHVRSTLLVKERVQEMITQEMDESSWSTCNIWFPRDRCTTTLRSLSTGRKEDVQIEFGMWSSCRATIRNSGTYVIQEDKFWFREFQNLYIIHKINLFVIRVIQRRLTSFPSLQFSHDISRRIFEDELLVRRTHYPFECKLMLRDRYEMIPYYHVNSFLTRHKYIRLRQRTS